MTRYRRSSRASRAALALLLAGCTVERGGSASAAGADTPRAHADTPATAPAAPAALEPPHTLPPMSDSLVALGMPGERDTSAIAPTAEELALLRTQLVMPVAGVDSDALHDTFSEARGTRVHQALDIPAPRGTAVRSAAPGRVLKLFTSVAGGLMVYAADSTERFVLLYAHLDDYAPGLAEGAPLRAGQVIGIVGTTGNAPPDVPHLHFAIARTRNIAQWWTGTPLDARPLLLR